MSAYCDTAHRKEASVYIQPVLPLEKEAMQVEQTKDGCYTYMCGLSEGPAIRGRFHI